MNNINLILSSSSLNRRELLQRLQIPFICNSPDVDESPIANESPVQTARRLAKIKAHKTLAQLDTIKLTQANKPIVIIGSDQVAFRGGEIFDKPITKERATSQLQQMQGRAITFYTAVHLIKVANGKNYKGGKRNIHELFGGVSTNVVFRKLTKMQIEKYIELDNPLSCAGSARCESLGIALLSNVESTDPTALIGLPLIMLCEFLDELGVNILK